MTTRCIMRGCPVHYASGPDRDCGGHNAEVLTLAGLLPAMLRPSPRIHSDSEEHDDAPAARASEVATRQA